MNRVSLTITPCAGRILRRSGPLAGARPCAMSCARVTVARGFENGPRVRITVRKPADDQRVCNRVQIRVSVSPSRRMNTLTCANVIAAITYTQVNGYLRASAPDQGASIRPDIPLTSVFTNERSAQQ